MNLETVAEKVKELNEAIAALDLSALKTKYTRQELASIRETLNASSLIRLSYDISQLMEEKKREDCPELNGVHLYPVLREIDFMSEEKKIELDKHLSRFRVGNYLGSLHSLIKDESQLIEFLIAQGIVERVYAGVCPHCGGQLTSYLSQEEKKHFEDLMQLKKYNDEWLYEHDLVEKCCMDCDEYVDIPRRGTLGFMSRLRMIQAADFTLEQM